VSSPALGPTQCVAGAISLGLNRTGRQADHSSLSSAESRMCGAIPPLLRYAFMAWCPVKEKENHGDSFTFTLHTVMSKMERGMWHNAEKCTILTQNVSRL
jgi:hypothetical protein